MLYFSETSYNDFISARINFECLSSTRWHQRHAPAVTFGPVVSFACYNDSDVRVLTVVDLQVAKKFLRSYRAIDGPISNQSDPFPDSFIGESMVGVSATWIHLCGSRLDSSQPSDFGFSMSQHCNRFRNVTPRRYFVDAWEVKSQRKSCHIRACKFTLLSSSS